MLVRQGIGYRVIGGTKFYQRAEIKDLLAYLRVLVNETDTCRCSASSTPETGAGRHRDRPAAGYAREQGIPLRESWCGDRGAGPDLRCSGGVCTAGGGLRCWAGAAGRGGAAATDEDRVPVAEVVRQVLDESGLLEALKAERTLEAEGRIENLEEFVGVAQEFDRMNPEGTLTDFLQEISSTPTSTAWRRGAGHHLMTFTTPRD